MSEHQEWYLRAVNAYKNAKENEEENIKNASIRRAQMLLKKLQKLGVNTESPAIHWRGQDTNVVIDGITFSLQYFDGIEYVVGTGICAACGEPDGITQPLCTLEAIGAHILGELPFRHNYACLQANLPETSETRLLNAIREYVSDIVQQERP